jgi:alkylhydroperoxidase/carboxymuconolactone decarboxylase family protein YurZ/quinol monooxygenase YgiN
MESSDAERGQQFYERVFGHRKSNFDDLLDTLTIEHLFADVWSRDERLSTVDRSKLTVAMLAALGRESELKTHIEGALHQGIATGDLEEIMVHVAHYAGWPAGHRGLDILRDVKRMGKQVFWLLELTVKPGELSNFKTLLHEMVESTRAELATLNYEWFISDDGSVAYGYERYADSAAVMTHLQVFGEKFAERFRAAVDRNRLTVFGTPSDEVRKALSESGPAPTYQSLLCGFAKEGG